MIPILFSLMTKTSPFIPHDILPANIKTPMCWIQQTQMEEVESTAQMASGRWGELRKKETRRNLYKDEWVYTLTHALKHQN